MDYKGQIELRNARPRKPRPRPKGHEPKQRMKRLVSWPRSRRRSESRPRPRRPEPWQRLRRSEAEAEKVRGRG